MQKKERNRNGISLRQYLDLLGGQEVPVVLELAAVGLLVVDEDLVAAVGIQDQSVHVGDHVVLAPGDERGMLLNVYAL